MTAKRIRCLCGKIYDPSEHKCCPDCGVEVRVESISVIPPESKKVPAPVTDDGTTPQPSPQPAPAPVPVPIKDMRWAWVAGGAVLSGLLVFGVMQLIKPKDAVVVSSGGPQASISNEKDKDKHQGESKDKPKEGEEKKKDPETADTGDKKKGSPPPETDPPPKEPSPTPPPTNPAFEYKGDTIVLEPKADGGENGKALAKALESAGDGDTIVLPGGSYVVDGLMIPSSVRLQGQVTKGAVPPQPTITALGNGPCFRIMPERKVTLERLIVVQNAINPPAPALQVPRDCGIAILNCVVMARGNVVVLVQGASSLTASDSTFVSMAKDLKEASIVTMAGSASEDGLKFSFTKCEFNRAQTALQVGEHCQGQLNACKFSDIGLPDGSGATIRVNGSKASVLVDQCDFRKNAAGIGVTGGSVTVKGGTFAENGIPIDAPTKMPGNFVALTGKLTFTGVTFSSNRQGIMATEGGTLEVIDCHFENHGAKGKDPHGQFVSHALGAHGKNEGTGDVSSISVRGTDFTKSVSRIVSMYGGARLTMEDCRATGGGMDSMVISGDAPCQVSVKKCVFSGFPGGIVVGGGSVVAFQETELRDNDIGLEIRDEGSKVEFNNVTIAGCKFLGVVAYKKGELTARGSAFEKNAKVAVQAGIADKPEVGGSTIMLENCKFMENKPHDVYSGPQCRIVMKNTTFAPGAQPAVSRSPAGVVEADPPIAVLAENSSGPQQGPQPQPNPQPGPQKVPQKQTANNNTNRPPSGQRPQPQRPQPSRQPSLPGKMNEVIDVIDRIRRLTR